MSLFKRKERGPFGVQEAYSEPYEKVISHVEAREEVMSQRVKDSVIEKSVLETIGESTDPLAEKALVFVDGLPEPERTLFLQSVFQRLVLQAFNSSASGITGDKVRSHFAKEAERFGGEVVMHFGDGLPVWGNAPLESVVINESKPVYEQPMLEV